MPMSGYREDKKLLPHDQFTLGYQSARVGFGLLAIGVLLLVTGHLIWAGVAALIGATLLRYGLRNP
jgi:hypothetical protein